MAKIPQPRYACFILSNGNVAIGTKANFKEESYLKMKNGRSVKVKDYHISLDNCAVIPVAKLPVSVYPNFEGVRGSRELEEPLLREYLKAEKYPGRLELPLVIKPFTISESGLVDKVERQMAPVQKRLETLRRKKQAKREEEERNIQAQKYEWDKYKQTIKGLKEI